MTKEERLKMLTGMGITSKQVQEICGTIRNHPKGILTYVKSSFEEGPHKRLWSSWRK